MCLFESLLFWWVGENFCVFRFFFCIRFIGIFWIGGGSLNCGLIILGLYLWLIFELVFIGGGLVGLFVLVDNLDLVMVIKGEINGVLFLIVWVCLVWVFFKVFWSFFILVLLVRCMILFCSSFWFWSICSKCYLNMMK